MISPIINDQFKLLQQLHGASMRELPNGVVVTVPDVPLEPAGQWNKVKTVAHILAPVGYPQAKPDCFWVESDIRLASGAMPANSAINNTIGPPLLWFSWHVARWNPNTDTLKTYLNVVRERLRTPR